MRVAPPLTPTPTPNQVEVSNWINEFDQRNVVDSITRAKVEQLGLGTLTLTLTRTLTLTLTPNP